MLFCFLFFSSEMGIDRASAPAAGPLPGHFSLHGRVKGQDGALQFKRAQTGEKKNAVSGSHVHTTDFSGTLSTFYGT